MNTDDQHLAWDSVTHSHQLCQQLVNVKQLKPQMNTSGSQLLLRERKIPTLQGHRADVGILIERRRAGLCRRVVFQL